MVRKWELNRKVKLDNFVTIQGGRKIPTDKEIGIV
jgi:hypothetical protein